MRYLRLRGRSSMFLFVTVEQDPKENRPITS